MSDISQNVRFLLWTKGVARSEWPAKLVALLGWTQEAAETFLMAESGVLGDKELKVLAHFGGVTEADLVSKAVLTGKELDLFHENLSFLIDLLPHGEKKRFAERLGVDSTTISRWKSGVQKPTRRKLILILRYFGLQDDTDLNAEPVFLSAGPVGTGETRKWLHTRIDEMDAGVLDKLFPALARLVRAQ